MTSIKRICQLAAIVIPVFCAVACGSAGPETMDENGVKAALEKAKPEEQIDWIKRSPMPAAEKQKKIAEIEQKYGISGGSVSNVPGAPSKN